jgi:hypothetical protein
LIGRLSYGMSMSKSIWMKSRSVLKTKMVKTKERSVGKGSRKCDGLGSAPKGTPNESTPAQNTTRTLFSEKVFHPKNIDEPICACCNHKHKKYQIVCEGCFKNLMSFDREFIEEVLYDERE